jgi:hypothetical protein
MHNIKNASQSNMSHSVALDQMFLKMQLIFIE